MTLKSKIAVITGAAQGIGAGIAKKLHQDGATVALVDLDLEKLKAASKEVCTGNGDAVQIFAADVSNKDSVTKLIESILKKNGKIDILVNNAGVIRDGMIKNISEEDWDKVIDVNLKGSFLMCQAVYPSMKEKQYGKIVNISSRSWLGNIGQSNYSASKGGVVSLTRALALEFARFQINVNAVAPGFIDTPMTRSMPSEARERLIKMQPTGKIGSVEDIANAVEFLASDRAEFITGQVLHVDGGKSCGILSL